MAPETPMKTTASCLGSESTADAVKIQKPIPHVENTAVRTVPPTPRTSPGQPSATAARKWVRMGFKWKTHSGRG